MHPAVESHHGPEMVRWQAAEVRDHGHEHAFEPLLVQGAGQMVMIDQVGLAFEAGDDRHHVGGKEPGQVGGGLRLPGDPLDMHFVHAERHLSGTKAQDRRRQENGIAQT